MAVQPKASAMANMGLTQWPIGTTTEITAAGYDAKKVASCCGKDSGNRPCPVFESCQFHLISMGGFKQSGGPKYVGYRYYDPADGTANQDVVMCHNWVLSMQGKADANAALRRRTAGKHGAIIRIIAQEGEEIITRYDLPINGKGQVIHPMPEMIEILKANKVDYSTLPNEQWVAQRYFELKRMVPKHPRPGESQGDSWAHKVAMLDAERETHDREYVDYGMPAPIKWMEGEGDKEVDKKSPWKGAGKPKNEGSQT